MVSPTGIVSSVPAMLPVDDPDNSSTANSDARKKLKTEHNNSSSSSEDNKPSTSTEIHPTDMIIITDDEPSEQSTNMCGVEDQNSPESPSKTAKNKNNPSDGLPELVSAPGTEWRWKEFPEKPYKLGASPAEITASSIDSSYLLTWLIESMEW